MGTATVYLKGGTDKLIICKIRQAIQQPFQAPNWTDLRVGWLLSITRAALDDDTTSLGDTIGTPPRPFLGPEDRYKIGLVDRATGSVFCGFTNRGPGRTIQTEGTSDLVTSDSAVGTTNANFWRPMNGLSHTWVLAMVDGAHAFPPGVDGSQIHMVQSAVGAGGYATLLALRFTRPNNRSNVITMTCKRDVAGHSGDILFTNSPTKDLLLTNLQSFPTNVQQLGPWQLSQVPDSFYVYWPWRSSRLRVSAMGFVKAG